MQLFFFRIWLVWVIRVVFETVLFSFAGALSVVGYIYVKKSFPTLDQEILVALGDIFVFWFMLFWNGAVLLALFRSIKYIFNRCFHGYIFRLYDCSRNEYIEPVGYGDLVKVWRRWFMLMIWLVATEILVLAIVMRASFSYTNVFEWLGSGVLFLLIVIAGYFSLMVISGRCKRIKVQRC